jgi:myo-inositol-1(or 4)-monophosphatase
VPGDASGGAASPGDVAVRAARAAGAALLARYGSAPTGVAAKSSATDMVSDADRAAEAAALGVIRAERPADPVLAEEGGGSADVAGDGLLWIVDPLDGTTNYLARHPAWSVSVACADAAGVLAAAVLHPLSDELFRARRGEGAWLGDARLAVRRPASLDVALVATGFSYSASRRAQQAQDVARVLPRVRDIRRCGSAALDLAWVAAGRVDGYWETPLMRWDAAAGVLLVREAGGVVSELPAADGAIGVVAASPALHDLLRRLVTGPSSRSDTL